MSLFGLLVGGLHSTVDLIVEQWWHWNTHRVTDSYLKVHQTTAALQMLTLHNECKRNKILW